MLTKCQKSEYIASCIMTFENLGTRRVTIMSHIFDLIFSSVKKKKNTAELSYKTDKRILQTLK